MEDNLYDFYFRERHNLQIASTRQDECKSQNSSKTFVKLALRQTIGIFLGTID